MNTTESNKASTTTTAAVDEYFEKFLSVTFACKIVIYTCLIITVWILICVIIYGTKTGRWIRKPGSSRLNSGEIFIVCVIAIALNIPRSAMNIVLSEIRTIGNETLDCATAGDVVGGTYFASECMTYIFLWILLQYIYTHPSVKRRVNIHVNRFSKIFVIFIVIVFVPVGILYVITNVTYEDPMYGCQVVRTNKKVSNQAAAISASVFVIQVLLLALFIYAAIRSRFDASEEAGANYNKGTYTKFKAMSKWFTFFPCCGDSYMASPIEMTVKRAVFSTSIIVFTDITSALFEAFLIPKISPKIYPVPSHDLSSLVNVLCMLYTFGFSGQILTVLIPNCPRKIRFSNKTTPERIGNNQQPGIEVQLQPVTVDQEISSIN